MNSDILDEHLLIARQLVNSNVYLDGVEWWYFMKINNGVDVYWNKVLKMLLHD